MESTDGERLGDGLEVSLSDLLTKSRRELSTLFDDHLDRLKAMQQNTEKIPREGRFLPQLRVPLVLPVWQEAKFSERLQLTLPPYTNDTTRDADLAQHLARYGDLDGARKLGAAGVEEQHRVHYERNYPVEWSRLVVLLFHTAYARLAAAEPNEGVAELGGLHRQLRKVFSAKELQSPLASVLLAHGRTALQQSLPAWKKWPRPGPTDLTEIALREWGDVPGLAPRLAPGANKAEVVRLWTGTPEGRALIAPTPGRALDVTGLPFPVDGVQGVVACFDESDRLTGIVATYRAGIGQLYPEPGHFAATFEEHGLPGQDSNRTGGVLQRSYTWKDVVCDVLLPTRNSRVGAIVCLRQFQPSKPALSRSLGNLHLDGTFESNRLRVAPLALGDGVETEQPDVLAQLNKLLPEFHAVSAVLECVPKSDVTRRFLLKGDREVLVSVFKLAGPLWSAHGLGGFLAVEDERGDKLALTWDDGRTRYSLLLPNNVRFEHEFEMRNLAVAQDLVDASHRAKAFDQAQRKARLDAGQPWRRLSRALPGYDNVQLGMTENDVERAIPRLEKKEFGWRKLFQPTGQSTPHFLRQLVLRFGPDRRVVELRALYQDYNPAGTGEGVAPGLLGELQRTGGLVAAHSSPWAERWKDLSPKTPAVAYRWQDDRTLATFERSGDSTEIVLRDCPAAQPDGVTLPGLAFCSTGPEGFTLGSTREQVLGAWKGPKPAKPDAVPLALNSDRPEKYDGYLLWFDNNRLVKVVARHSTPGIGVHKTIDLVQALNSAWGQELKNLGCWSRVDATAEGQPQSYGWLDAHTRLRLFWQENQESLRMFTEWQSAK
jgi:hypothetical protein